MADFAVWVTKLVPAWLIFTLALLTTIHRFYVSCRWEWNIISQWENVLYAIALLNITVFYAGRWLNWWDIYLSISLSRLVWAWLLLVSLYISHRMAKRHKDGLE